MLDGSTIKIYIALSDDLLEAFLFFLAFSSSIQTCFRFTSWWGTSDANGGEMSMQTLAVFQSSSSFAFSVVNFHLPCFKLFTWVSFEEIMWPANETSKWAEFILPLYYLKSYISQSVLSLLSRICQLFIQWCDFATNDEIIESIYNAISLSTFVANVNHLVWIGFTITNSWY